MPFLPIIVFSSLLLAFSRHTLFDTGSHSLEEEQTDSKKIGVIKLTDDELADDELADVIAIYIKDKINKKSDS